MAKQPENMADAALKEDSNAWERFESAVDKVMRGGPQHRKAPEWVSRATVEIRRVGPNDAGIPEDAMMPMVIPRRLSAGKIFVDDQTGDRFDRDGRLLGVVRRDRASSHG